jgi:hypothetical protein
VIAYFFRFVNQDGPTGWFGFAVARDQDQMFWQIDEHGPANACEIQTATEFSWCGFWTDGNDADEGGAFGDHEVSESAYGLPDASKWRTPPWVVRDLEAARVAKPKRETFGYDKGALF